MPCYKAPLQDIQFILNDLIDVGQLQHLPGWQDVTPELIDHILAEGAKFVENELFPLNQPGDAEGCRFENGVVRTPQGFREAYARFIAGGWTGLAADPAYGGQGLPQLVNFVMMELMWSANLAFGIFYGLSHGAYDALAAYASDELKRIYLPKLIDGTWTGTMCLTEPQAGSDLGLVRTRAEPRGDGSYAVTGTKIFISGGEHDLTGNIVHLVLARLPGAPAGTRGISLFLVPKYLPREENGTVLPGMRNGVTCGGIERKMGLKASPTCVLNFDAATGWLVGEPHKGMRAMFVMMNAARLAVGLQGLGLAEVSYQNARDYARERLQGRALGGARAPDRQADPIIAHPDVRRMLLTMKACNEGGRALAYWVALHVDLSMRHPDPAVRQEADDLVALLIPVVKAWLTDMGSACCNLGLQVLGGHGYIADWGMEQYVRDARITQIYEGTNGIQALDLVGRKLPQDMGRRLRRFFHPVDRFLSEHAGDPAMTEFLVPLAKAFGRLQQATAWIGQQGMKSPEDAAAAATDYLRLFSLVAIGFMWARMVVAARAGAGAGDGRATSCEAKVKTARFFMQHLLPQTGGLFVAVMAGARPLMELEAEAF